MGLFLHAIAVKQTINITAIKENNDFSCFDLIIIKKLTKELITGYTKQAEVEILTDFFSILECKINKIVELLNWEDMNNELL